MQGPAPITPRPPPRIGLVLSGFAPAMTLMSGTLLGFSRHHLNPAVIGTAGVGGLIGLLYLAPRGARSRDEALAALPNLFVSDLIYDLFPINFKIFFKQGPFSQSSWELRKRLPKFAVRPEAASPFKRFLNDWTDLVMCALTPTPFDFFSKSLMTQVPLIDELVDFDRLRSVPTRLYLNAFDLSSRQMRVFDNGTLNADTYHAAQSMFFLYGPQRVGGDLFTTGATHDPTGLAPLWQRHKQELDLIIALDPLSAAIWRRPTDIYDAFQIMLMNPIMALQEVMLAFYAKTEYCVNAEASPRSLPRLYRVPFDLDPAYYPHMLKWTHANAVTLQDVGVAAGDRFAQALRSGTPQALEPYRYYHYVEANDRFQSLLCIFDRMFEAP